MPVVNHVVARPSASFSMVDREVLSLAVAVVNKFTNAGLSVGASKVARMTYGDFQYNHHRLRT